MLHTLLSQLFLVNLCYIFVNDVIYRIRFCHVYVRAAQGRPACVGVAGATLTVMRLIRTSGGENECAYTPYFTTSGCNDTFHSVSGMHLNDCACDIARLIWNSYLEQNQQFIVIRCKIDYSKTSNSYVQIEIVTFCPNDGCIAQTVPLQ